MKGNEKVLPMGESSRNSDMGSRRKGNEKVLPMGERGITATGSRKVSVVVPNYNYGRYLRGRVRSILRQSYPIFELIILDDASTDGSGETAEKIAEEVRRKFPEMKVKFLRNEKNSGKAILQWKKGFLAAEGEFVWIAEADDLSNRRFLEKVMEGFSDPKVLISYAESRVISGSGMILAPNFRWSRDKEKTGHFRKSYVKDGREEIREIMAIRCTIPNVSAAVFRKVRGVPYEKYLDEAAKFSQVGDWYFYAKILEHGKISYEHAALNYFRVHRGSVTGKARSGREHYEEVLKMHQWFLENFEISGEVRKRIKKEELRIKERDGIIEA